MGLSAFAICSLMAQNVKVKSKKDNKGKIFKEVVSIQVHDSPLYVIGGIPQSDKDPLKGLTTDSIKGVRIVKGIPEAALYGARGYKGVIIITTKSGKVKNN